MTLQITGARLDGYRPGSSAPDYQIPGEHIYSFDVEQKVGDLKDTGKLAIDNRDNRYTNVIDHGDMIRINVEIEGSESQSFAKYSTTSFGSASYGGSGGGRVWTGMIRDYDVKYEGAGHSSITIDAEDYVFAVMDFRRVYNEWRDRQIVGENGIINEVLTDECPEIDQGLLPDRAETTSIGVFGDTVRDLIGELALRLPAVPYSDDVSLRFDHPDTLSPDFTLTEDDWGVFTYGSQDEGLFSLVRIRGGTASQIDDEQLTQNDTVTATDSSFVTQRISTRKSFVSEIDLYTVADRTGEDIIIRLQKDVGDGSGPIDPNDDTSDISSRRLSAEFLDDDGFTLFELPTDEENVLPEPNPWMIIQTDGSTGQQIGIDSGTGNVAYRAFYPYPIVVEQEDGATSSEYRLRDGDVSKRSISTFNAARDEANSFLRDHAQPTETLQFDAQSPQMHEHGVGQSIQVDEVAASGAFVSTEKKDHYEGNLLKTSFSFQSLESI